MNIEINIMALIMMIMFICALIYTIILILIPFYIIHIAHKIDRIEETINGKENKKQWSIVIENERKEKNKNLEE